MLVRRRYDSLSNVTREVQNQIPPFDVENDDVVLSTYDGVGNETACTYPGGRKIETTYDELERKRAIADTTGGGNVPVADYDYIGPGRVERRDHGNGTRTDFTYDGITGTPNPPDDFGVKRLIRTRHSVIAGGATIDDRTYRWDRMYNKVQRKDVRAGGPQLTHDYEYDAIYRLTQTTVTAPGPVVVRNTDYTLDGVGNRSAVAGNPDPGPYDMSPVLPEPGDFQMNQYTTTSFDARQYDENGNLIHIDKGLSSQPDIAYDYRNQMVEYVAAGETHTYAYDALGRRIRRVLDSTGIPVQTRYFYDGWQVVEEQDQLGTTQATYVYGNYIDEVLNMQHGGSDYFYHTDDLYNVMAITNFAGTDVERYEYADYGQPVDPSSLSPSVPSSLNSYLFTGRRYDPETTFYYYRTRYLDPIAGRFTTRDTLGTWTDLGNTGNSYAYAGNRPVSYLDPFGYCGPTLVVDATHNFQIRNYNIWSKGNLLSWQDYRIGVAGNGWTVLTASSYDLTVVATGHARRDDYNAHWKGPKRIGGFSTGMVGGIRAQTRGGIVCLHIGPFCVIAVGEDTTMSRNRRGGLTVQTSTKITL